MTDKILQNPTGKGPIMAQTLLSLQILGELGRAGKLSIPEAAQRANLAQTYTVKLLQKMRVMGLVFATRGRSGGYELAQPPARMTALGVVRALEGGVLPEAETDSPQTKAVKSKLREPLRKALKAISIADL